MGSGKYSMAFVERFVSPLGMDMMVISLLCQIFIAACKTHYESQYILRYMLYHLNGIQMDNPIAKTSTTQLISRIIGSKNRTCLTNPEYHRKLQCLQRLC